MVEFSGCDSSIKISQICFCFDTAENDALFSSKCIPTQRGFELHIIILGQEAFFNIVQQKKIKSLVAAFCITIILHFLMGLLMQLRARIISASSVIHHTLFQRLMGFCPQKEDNTNI